MKMILMAVRDAKVSCFMRPWVARSEGEAIRAFADLVNEPGHDLNKHPEDYTLFQVGKFDDQTGEVSDATCVSVCGGLAVLKRRVSESQVGLLERVNGRDPDLVMDREVTQ